MGKLFCIEGRFSQIYRLCFGQFAAYNCASRPFQPIIVEFAVSICGYHNLLGTSCLFCCCCCCCCYFCQHADKIMTSRIYAVCPHWIPSSFFFSRNYLQIIHSHMLKSNKSRRSYDHCKLGVLLKIHFWTDQAIWIIWTLSSLSMKTDRTWDTKIIEHFITFLTRGRTQGFDSEWRSYD
jgi:hypothetical protein